MTSRERILAAIRHEQPDQVPVDFGATPSSGISAIAYNNLKKYLNFDQHTTLVYDVVQQLARPGKIIFDLYEIDVFDIERTFNTGDIYWHNVFLPDGSEAMYPAWFHPVKDEEGTWNVYDDENVVIAKMPKSSTFFNQSHFPFLNGYPSDFNDLSKAMKKVMWSAMAICPWDHAHEPDFWEQLREKTLRLREKTDKALIIGVGCNLFEWGTFLRRIDNFLMDLVMDTHNVERLLDALMEIHLSILEKVCKAVGDVVDIIKFGDDLGMQNGPFMSPETYRKFFKPRHTLLCDYVKQNSRMFTYLHSCGSIYDLIPDLIEAGFEVLNPVQTNCRNMDPVRLKKEFGKDITFWGGGVDTASVLNHATPEKVREQVLERLEIFSPGGGYVFNTIHNILPEVPPENIVAMFEAVKEFNGQK